MPRPRALLLVCWSIAIALVACRTPPARTGDPAAVPMPIAPDAGVAIAPPAPAPITDAECAQFVDHTLALGMAQQRATKPAEYVPTGEQLAAIRTRLIAARPCADLTRPQWACAIEAASQDALYRCAQ